MTFLLIKLRCQVDASVDNFPQLILETSGWTRWLYWQHTDCSHPIVKEWVHGAHCSYDGLAEMMLQPLLALWNW